MPQYEEFLGVPPTDVADALKRFKDQKRKSKMEYWNLLEPIYSRYIADGFPILAEVARRALALHPTACAAERNWSAWRRLCKVERASLSLESAWMRMEIAEFYNGH